jgi:hypothetical protein
MEAALSKLMKERKIPQSRDNIELTYTRELRLYFHIVLCMSPVGE